MLNKKIDISKLIKRKNVKRFHKLLNEPNTGIKIEAIYALSKIRNHRSILPLILTLSDENKMMNQFILESLSKFDMQNVISELSPLLSDNDFSHRLKAVIACSGLSINSDDIIEKLIQLLNDKYPKIRSNAAVALGNMKANNAINELLNTINDDEINVRCSGIWALGKIGNAKVLEPLLLLLKQNETEIRSTVISSLKNFKDDRIVDTLTEYFYDDTIEEKKEIIKTLGQIKHKKSEALFIDALDDDNSQVRQCAAEALRNYPTKKNVNILLKEFQDQDSTTRIIIIESIVKIIEVIHLNDDIDSDYIGQIKDIIYQQIHNKNVKSYDNLYKNAIKTLTPIEKRLEFRENKSSDW